jgi:hypothetical protein
VSVTVQTLMDRAKRRVGLVTGMEDDLLTQQLFLDRVNEILQEFAQWGDGFREELSVDLLSSSAVHPLSSRVLRVIPNTVRVDYDGSSSWLTEPERVTEELLRNYYQEDSGVLENIAAGTPLYYYTGRGSAADATLALVLHPKSDRAVTSGIKFWAQTTPALLTVLTATVPVQLHEERFILPGICAALAQVEANRDSKRLPQLQFWEAKWERARTDYVDQVEDGLRGSTRRILYADPFD